jgi:Ca2+-binding RTX toxin-like protein
MMRRLIAPCAATAALLAVAAPAAPAATVGNAAGFRLDFVPGAGEANRVKVTSSGGRLVVTDLGVANLQVEGTCVLDAIDPQTASCPEAGITELSLGGGDLDDEITNATAVGGEIRGDDGHDVLRGGDPAERLIGGAGPDQVEGGFGDDRLYGATLQNPNAGSDTDDLTGGLGNDRLVGSGGPDRLGGGPGDDQLEGGGGSDDLRGEDGTDGLIGGDGDDAEDGGTGDDTVGTEITLGVVETPQDLGNDVLLGGEGNDTLLPGPGPPLADADTIGGGDGLDFVSYRTRMASVYVTKDGGADDGGLAEGDNVGVDVERISGGLASDTLRGGDGPDVLEGAAGDDTVEGLAGDDQLLGDAGEGGGSDTVSGGPGADIVRGEGGGDTLSGNAESDTVEGGTGADTLSGGADADEVLGGAGRDEVAYSTEQDVTVRLDAGIGRTSQPGDRDRVLQVEDVSGGNQRDTLTGTTEANALVGAKGEDYVDGRRGRDLLDGGPSADLVAARDGARDEPVSCGPGVDFAIVDRQDRAVRRGRRRCEQVDDGSQREPRPGRVYVQPQRCAGSEDDVELGLPAMHRLVPLLYSVMLPSGYRRRPAPTLDVTGCGVRLTATPGQGRTASAAVSGGAVTVDQTTGRRVTTMLTLKPPSCVAGSRSAGASTHWRRVRVTSRRGRWRVRGSYSIGASYGTDWTTVERCSSTTTIVRSGRVQVYDRVKRRTVTVRAGHKYVSRARPRSSG